jgi:spore coat polysaccharide biosynthesis protein SpsF (cytidylyltransferase family)
MTFDALEAAWLLGKRADDREHVTPWLRRHPEIKRANLRQKADQSAINLCVDYPEDPARIELLLKQGFKPRRGVLQ